LNTPSLGTEIGAPGSRRAARHVRLFGKTVDIRARNIAHVDMVLMPTCKFHRANKRSHDRQDAQPMANIPHDNRGGATPWQRSLPEAISKKWVALPGALQQRELPF